MTIIVDTAEPEDMIRLLEQSVSVVINNLNQLDMADYYFGGTDSKTRQYCRVQTRELLSNIDSQEQELRDYYYHADENNLIIEGLISPVPLTRRDKSLDAISIRAKGRTDVLFSYSVTLAGYIYDERVHNVGSAMLDSWLFQLDQAGIGIYYTVNYAATAALLVAHYKSCQKSPDTHSTLQRYTRPRLQLKQHDPFIKALMYLSAAYDIGIGETKATAIREAGYNSLLDIGMSSVAELCRVDGIGKKLASKLLEAIGRSKQDE